MIRRAALLALLALPAAAQAPTSIRALGVEGTDFRLTLNDGRVLRGADLVGATLDLGTVGAIRIAALEPDARDPRGEILLFDFRDAADAPLCSPDPDGRALGFPLADTGDPARLTLACTSGAIGKCVRFGYAPWRTTSNNRPMADYHAACVRLLRADYGGDGRPWTRNGMRIDLHDRIGVQQPDTNDVMPFEAGWTPGGAVCLAHARVPEHGDLAAITAAHPRLAASSGAACTEAAAVAAGALLFNRSARN